MPLWIPFVVFAAFMQSWRNAFQKQLSYKKVPVFGVTLARFIMAAPMAALYLFFLHAWRPIPLPAVSAKWAVLVFFASIAQIIATSLMVQVFQLKNYAMGVGLAKSEAVIAAVLGVIWFNAPLSFWGWVGVVMGGVAVLLMSGVHSFRAFPFKTVALGLGSGLSFALTSLWVREASLDLGMPFPHSAAWVLLAVLTLQTLLLGLWLLLRDLAALKALLRQPLLMFLTSLASFLGSVGWFTAMSLEKVPLVKTLGQVEIFFTLLISFFWFNEKLNKKDIGGFVLIAVAVICVVLA